MTLDWTIDDWQELTTWAAENVGALSERDHRFALAFLALLQSGEPIAQTHQQQAGRIWHAYSASTQAAGTPTTLEQWLRDLPRPSWFALWADADGSGEPVPGKSHCLEVRLTGTDIELRATGNQHVDSAHQLTPDQLDRLEGLGWLGRTDYRRRLWLKGLADDDVQGALQMIRETAVVYGLETPLVEAPEAIAGLVTDTVRVYPAIPSA